MFLSLEDVVRRGDKIPVLGDMYLRNLIFYGKGWTRWPLEVSSSLGFDSKILLHRHKTCGENTLRHLLTMFSRKVKYFI